MIKNPLKGALHSYSFRIALLYVLFFLISTSILFVFIYLTSTRSATEQLDETLDSDHTALSERFQQSGLNGLIRMVNSRAQSQGRDSVYSLIAKDKEIIAGNLASWPELEQNQGRVEFLVSKSPWAPLSNTFRGDVIEIPEGYRLLVARSKQVIKRAQQKLINTFIWAAMITLFLGLTGGYLLSKRAVRRISSINGLCRTIVEGDFSQRLTVPEHVQDDLDDLSVNINSMLDKIDALMREIVQVSDNIAHDMRTPLSHLRLKLEAIQSHPHTDETVLEKLTESIADTDSIIDTFNALLRISKIQAAKKTERFEAVHIESLLNDVIELYAPLAEDKRQLVSLNIEQDIQFDGDRDLLFQAISNLLDNAIKYTPSQGHIRLTLNRVKNSAHIRVCDDGSGVPDGELTHLSRRFYRVDSSRTLPGSGLGLSLVEAVTKLHLGQLDISSNFPHGLCVTMVLPL